MFPSDTISGRTKDEQEFADLLMSLDFDDMDTSATTPSISQQPPAQLQSDKSSQIPLIGSDLFDQGIHFDQIDDDSDFLGLGADNNPDLSDASSLDYIPPSSFQQLHDGKIISSKPFSTTTSLYEKHLQQKTHDIDDIYYNYPNFSINTRLKARANRISALRGEGNFGNETMTFFETKFTPLLSQTFQSKSFQSIYDQNFDTVDQNIINSIQLCQKQEMISPIPHENESLQSTNTPPPSLSILSPEKNSTPLTSSVTSNLVSFSTNDNNEGDFVLTLLPPSYSYQSTNLTTPTQLLPSEHQQLLSETYKTQQTGMLYQLPFAPVTSLNSHSPINSHQKIYSQHINLYSNILFPHLPLIQRSIQAYFKFRLIFIHFTALLQYLSSYQSNLEKLSQSLLETYHKHTSLALPTTLASPPTVVSTTPVISSNQRSPSSSSLSYPHTYEHMQTQSTTSNTFFTFFQQITHLFNKKQTLQLSLDSLQAHLSFLTQHHTISSTLHTISLLPLTTPTTQTLGANIQAQFNQSQHIYKMYSKTNNSSCFHTIPHTLAAFQNQFLHLNNSPNHPSRVRGQHLHNHHNTHPNQTDFTLQLKLHDYLHSQNNAINTNITSVPKSTPQFNSNSNSSSLAHFAFLLKDILLEPEIDLSRGLYPFLTFTEWSQELITLSKFLHFGLSYCARNKLQYHSKILAPIITNYEKLLESFTQSIPLIISTQLEQMFQGLCINIVKHEENNQVTIKSNATPPSRSESMSSHHIISSTIISQSTNQNQNQNWAKEGQIDISSNISTQFLSPFQHSSLDYLHLSTTEDNLQYILGNSISSTQLQWSHIFSSFVYFLEFYSYHGLNLRLMNQTLQNEQENCIKPLHLSQDISQSAGTTMKNSVFVPSSIPQFKGIDLPLDGKELQQLILPEKYQQMYRNTLTEAISLYCDFRMSLLTLTSNQVYASYTSSQTTANSNTNHNKIASFGGKSFLRSSTSSATEHARLSVENAKSWLFSNTISSAISKFSSFYGGALTYLSSGLENVAKLVDFFEDSVILRFSPQGAHQTGIDSSSNDFRKSTPLYADLTTKEDIENEIQPVHPIFISPLHPSTQKHFSDHYELTSPQFDTKSSKQALSFSAFTHYLLIFLQLQFEYEYLLLSSTFTTEPFHSTVVTTQNNIQLGGYWHQRFFTPKIIQASSLSTGSLPIDTKDPFSSIIIPDYTPLSIPSNTSTTDTNTTHSLKPTQIHHQDQFQNSQHKTLLSSTSIPTSTALDLSLPSISDLSRQSYTFSKFFLNYPTTMPDEFTSPNVNPTSSHPHSNNNISAIESGIMQNQSPVSPTSTSLTPSGCFHTKHVVNSQHASQIATKFNDLLLLYVHNIVTVFSSLLHQLCGVYTYGMISPNLLPMDSMDTKGNKDNKANQSGKTENGSKSSTSTSFATNNTNIHLQCQYVYGSYNPKNSSSLQTGQIHQQQTATKLPTENIYQFKLIHTAQGIAILHNILTILYSHRNALKKQLAIAGNFGFLFDLDDYDSFESSILSSPITTSASKIDSKSGNTGKVPFNGTQSPTEHTSDLTQPQHEYLSLDELFKCNVQSAGLLPSTLSYLTILKLTHLTQQILVPAFGQYLHYITQYFINYHKLLRNLMSLPILNANSTKFTPSPPLTLFSINKALLPFHLVQFYCLFFQFSKNDIEHLTKLLTTTGSQLSPPFTQLPPSPPPHPSSPHPSSQTSTSPLQSNSNLTSDINFKPRINPLEALLLEAIIPTSSIDGHLCTYFNWFMDHSTPGDNLSIYSHINTPLLNPQSTHPLPNQQNDLTNSILPQDPVASSKNDASTPIKNIPTKDDEIISTQQQHQLRHQQQHQHQHQPLAKLIDECGMISNYVLPSTTYLPIQFLFSLSKMLGHTRMRSFFTQQIPINTSLSKLGEHNNINANVIPSTSNLPFGLGAPLSTLLNSNTFQSIQTIISSWIGAISLLFPIKIPHIPLSLSALPSSLPLLSQSPSTVQPFIAADSPLSTTNISLFFGKSYHVSHHTQLIDLLSSHPISFSYIPISTPQPAFSSAFLFQHVFSQPASPSLQSPSQSTKLTYVSTASQTPTPITKTCFSPALWFIRNIPSTFSSSTIELHPLVTPLTSLNSSFTHDALTSNSKIIADDNLLLSQLAFISSLFLSTLLIEMSFGTHTTPVSPQLQRLQPKHAQGDHNSEQPTFSQPQSIPTSSIQPQLIPVSRLKLDFSNIDVVFNSHPMLSASNHIPAPSPLSEHSDHHSHNILTGSANPPTEPTQSTNTINKIPTTSSLSTKTDGWFGYLTSFIPNTSTNFADNMTSPRDSGNNARSKFNTNIEKNKNIYSSLTIDPQLPLTFSNIHDPKRLHQLYSSNGEKFNNQATDAQDYFFQYFSLHSFGSIIITLSLRYLLQHTLTIFQLCCNLNSACDTSISMATTAMSPVSANVFSHPFQPSFTKLLSRYKFTLPASDSQKKLVISHLSNDFHYHISSSTPSLPTNGPTVTILHCHLHNLLLLLRLVIQNTSIVDLIIKWTKRYAISILQMIKQSLSIVDSANDSNSNTTINEIVLEQSLAYYDDITALQNQIQQMIDILVEM